MATNVALAHDKFQRQLAFGQIAETDIALWLMHRGGVVLPIYDIEYDTGKGPRMFLVDRSLVAPDLLVFSRGSLKWIEAKHKSVFTWHWTSARKGKSEVECWQTGIDQHHYRQYLEVEKVSGVPIWLLFFHITSTPDSRDLNRSEWPCPEKCPVGLFGAPLKELSECVHHTDWRWGRHGMVYWMSSSLRLIATLEEVQKSANARRK